MPRGYDLMECLDAIDPASLAYSEWVSVGMALKQEGLPFEAWDAWSRRDAVRYRGDGGMARKWAGFEEREGGVAGGTIVELAREAGWSPASEGEGHALSWDGEVWDGGAEAAPGPVDPSWVESRDLAEPGEGWEGWRDLARYLEAVFEPSDVVGYVTEAWDKDGRWVPASKGPHSETAGELIERVTRYGEDLGASVGWHDEAAGAWIRFNPLDGQGVRNANVAEFRHALVESDEMDVGRQLGIIEELRLPVAALVHSGNKSLHAIVRVDAADYAEYRKRVDTLYAECAKAGLKVDTQNKNPSRLSRMPGVTRGGRKQWLVATDVGCASWAEWREWVAEQTDDLPEPENLASVWDDMPDLAPPLIEGVLRQGHKMLLAGPSKAGKSFALIELCVSIAEGLPWLGFPCAQGRVLYVNLELDRASCLHRFRDVYGAMGAAPEHVGDIDVWNLRGKSKPMDALAPSLIRRALRTRPAAVVIDPIYKVITGDENSADQMAAFCNNFDKVATELGCAVVYCHHHSKGGQGQKRSMDRASGSGVFARDPDALLDMIELHRSEDLRKQQEDEEVCRALAEFLDGAGPAGWRERVGQDAAASAARMLDEARAMAREAGREGEMLAAVVAARARAKARTAWRVEGTLREFPRFDPVDLWFDHPTHRVDKSGVLGDAAYEGDVLALDAGRAMGREKAAESRARGQDEKNRLMREAFEECARDGVPPTRASMLERIGEFRGKEVSQRMLQRWTTPSASKWTEFAVDPEREKEGLLADLAAGEMLADW